jgi:antitoxin VapB
MGKLSIRDEGVNDLAERLARIIGVNKTEAVKRALENEIKRQESAPSIEDKVAALREKLKDAGFLVLDPLEGEGEH